MSWPSNGSTKEKASSPACSAASASAEVKSLFWGAARCTRVLSLLNYVYFKWDFHKIDIFPVVDDDSLLSRILFTTPTANCMVRITWHEIWPSDLSASSRCSVVPRHVGTKTDVALKFVRYPALWSYGSLRY